MEAAKATHCQNNLRQIGSGSTLYSADWKGQIAPAMMYFPSVAYPYIQVTKGPTILAPYVNNGSNADNSVRKETWSCIKRNQAAYAGETPNDYGSNLNIHIFWDLYNPNQGWKRLKIRRQPEIINPSETIQYLDTTQATAGQSEGTIAGSEYPDFDNPATGNLLLDDYPMYHNAIVSNTPDWGFGYVPRYRHTNNKSINVLWCDSHVSPKSRNTLIYRNLTQAY